MPPLKIKSFYIPILFWVFERDYLTSRFGAQTFNGNFFRRSVWIWAVLVFLRPIIGKQTVKNSVRIYVFILYNKPINNYLVRHRAIITKVVITLVARINDLKFFS